MPDLLLRDRFVAGLKNGDVKRMVKMEVRKRPDMTFDDVRKEALFLSADRADQGEDLVEVNVSSAVSASSGSPSLKSLQTTLEETVKQQREMAEMMAAMRLELSQLRSAPATQNRRPRRQPQWDKEGNPICLICNQSGHMARDCPQRRPLQNQSPYQSFPKPSAPLN